MTPHMLCDSKGLGRETTRTTLTLGLLGLLCLGLLSLLCLGLLGEEDFGEGVSKDVGEDAGENGGGVIQFSPHSRHYA